MYKYIHTYTYIVMIHIVRISSLLCVLTAMFGFEWGQQTTQRHGVSEDETWQQTTQRVFEGLCVT
jgi:hypothetical protein